MIIMSKEYLTELFSHKSGALKELYVKRTTKKAPCEGCKHFTACKSNEIACGLFNYWVGMPVPLADRKRKPTKALFIAHCQYDGFED